MAIPERDGSSTLSSHVSDTILRPFLQQDFDAADYLNANLPNLSLSSQGSRISSENNANLADLSSQTQTLLSQLNAQTSRLTAVLTQLTDDIIRSGSRLAYEVDVLRGEALNLSEVVNDGLRPEISLFMKLSVEDVTQDGIHADLEEENVSIPEPQYISQLRMLTKVRQRLDGVIKIFGEAMQWTLPPSEITSITSSFISVSAPESGPESQSREQKGKEFAEKLRAEIADVVLSADESREGLTVAEARIDALRDLALVWKGTAEEKSRIRFVEGLTKLAEERLQELERGGNRARPARKSMGSRDVRGQQTTKKEAGFLEHLHELQQSKS
jgi:hypothetical protein